MNELYNKIPRNLGIFEIEVSEYFHYTYLPIKLSNSSKVIYEKRLKIFDRIIGTACCDFVGYFGLDRFIESYVYLTAKHQYQRAGSGFNRPGWHSDGFLTDDISYIWSNRQPTIFNSSDFSLSKDDILSMKEMEEQALEENDYEFPNNSLIQMDQYSIHKVGIPLKGNRVFAKLCFSKDKYNLKGNSVNYELSYDWIYHERQERRNIPQIV